MAGRTDGQGPTAFYCGMELPHSRVNQKSAARVTSDTRENLLLAALPVAERRRLLSHCEPVELAFGERLCEQGAQIQYVYFPTGGFISLISSLDGCSRLELGLVGSEGMLGISLLMGVTTAPLQALVQGGGTALRLDAAIFSRVLERSPALRKALMRYLYVLLSQLAQTARCLRFHVVESRLARWLLMTRDRAHSSKFYLTQEFLSHMLGVRRAGITGAARSLQRRKLIRYNRGQMSILDGRGLERAACECYAIDAEMYDRYLGE